MTLKKLAVMVTTPPSSNNTATAISYVESALNNKNIDVIGVFFYQEGVLNASQLLAMPNDELQAIKQWQNLHNNYQVPLHICISAAEKRGLTDSDEQINILSEFTISGLGELVELTARADRMVQL